MARRPPTSQRSNAPTPPALGELASTGAETDICPVCKSSRYLNPNMRFLVNPECYHKMCESCVDRIFSHGPAACPIAGCKKTLRKHRFRKQTFDDVRVEREVDIRRRIAEIFNRREDEFESLLDYNNHLEDVETLTFNLINNVDVDETERKLAAYRDTNAASIKANATLAREESASQAAQAAAEREQARLRRQAARREDEEERKEMVEGRRDIIDQLARGQGNAERIAQAGESVMLKRSSLRKEKWAGGSAAAAAAAKPAADVASNGGDFVIRGLKKRSDAPDKEAIKPYDPFGGLEYKMEYYVPSERLEWDWLDEARNNPVYTAGGYDVREYTQRALCEAFSGLGVFIEDEMANKHIPSATAVGTQAAVVAAAANGKAAESDDVF